jgi:hypothetical protein
MNDFEKIKLAHELCNDTPNLTFKITFGSNRFAPIKIFSWGERLWSVNKLDDLLEQIESLKNSYWFK